MEEPPDTLLTTNRRTYYCQPQHMNYQICLRVITKERRQNSPVDWILVEDISRTLKHFSNKAQSTFGNHLCSVPPLFILGRRLV